MPTDMTIQGVRSIPTCVGASRRSITTRAIPRVYPHVCGGILFGHAGGLQDEGLSPRVWGHHVTLTTTAASERSIPTCVGASPPDAAFASREQVYPHVCGGIWCV